LGISFSEKRNITQSYRSEDETNAFSFGAAALATADPEEDLMKKHLRILVALVVLAGSAMAAAPQFDGGNPPPCMPGTDCVPAA
jgi:hypothetical protein